jgi:tetratricopeptide (TPR) repeat protein
LYARTLTYGYNGDDDMFISENAITMSGFSRISEIFSDDGTINGWNEFNNTTIEKQGFTKRYRPISQLTFASEVALFGLQPGISHFINVLLYCFSVILIFVVLLKIQLVATPWHKSFAFWAAVLFAVHPIHTECVANIKSRDEILAFLFFLISLWVAFRDIKFKFFILFVLYLLALLSKENAITYLATVPLILYFASNQQIKVKDHIRFIAPFAIAAIVFLLLNFIIINNADAKEDVFSNYFFNLSASEKYGTILMSLGKYIQLLFLPVSMLCDYSIYQVPIVKISNLIAISIFIFHMVLLVIAFKLLKKKSIYSFAIFFYFITMSLYSNLVFNTGNAVAERFLYTSSLAFCVFLSFFFFNHFPLLLKKGGFLFSLLLILSIISFYSFKTIDRVSDWKDLNTLLAKDVNKKNNCARLNYSFAQLYFDGKQKKNINQDSLRVATHYYLKSVQIFPKYIDALNQLGLCYYYSEKYDSAIYYYCQSLTYNSEQLPVYKNISLILDSMKKDNNTICIRKKLINIKPDLAPLYYYLAKDYKYLGKKDSAIIYLKLALEKKPDYKIAMAELEKLNSN